MIDRLRSERLLLLGLVWVALLCGVVYASVIPPWQAPDEFRHFEYVRLIQINRRLVDYGDLSEPLQREIIASMIEHDYWKYGYATQELDPSNPPITFEEIVPPIVAHSLYQPPAYYAIVALLTVPLSKSDIVVQLYAMRFVSLLMGCLTVVLGFATARILFPKGYFFPIAVAAFVALLPMHAFITSSVNPDVLAELFVSLVVFLSVAMLRRGVSWAKLVALLCALAGAALTKRTALVAFPIAFIGMMLSLPRPGRSFRAAITGLALVALVLLAALAWWRLEPERSRRFVSRTIDYLAVPKDPLSFVSSSKIYSRRALRRYARWGTMMFKSFWAYFGWLKVPLAPIWYRIIGGVCALSGLGLIAGVGQVLSRSIPAKSYQKKGMFLLSVSVFLAILIIFVGRVALQETHKIGGPAGRYLFPVIIPLATLFTLGLRSLVPTRSRRSLLALYLGCFVIFDIICLTGYVVPYFYR